MTKSADRLPACPAAPATMLSCRSHGNLDAITDSERRALRPIGMTAHEVAAKTGALLAELCTHPGVRIFQGLRPTAANMPRVPHAINAGRRLVLVESVAWPPGSYAITAAGRISCDGVYTGQSVRPLMAAVRHWRETLPQGHRVSALVVVHPTASEELALQATAGTDLAWTRARNAVRDIRACLPPEQQPTSIKAVAALIAAIAE